jgi:hypothetical protein
MKECVLRLCVLCFALLANPILEARQGPTPGPAKPALGRRESGAATLMGYLIQNTPCIPIKKFAQDAGIQSSVSPSRRGVAIIVGKKICSVLNLRLAVIDGKEFPLSVEAVEREGDFFVPLEFYEKAFPNSVRYNPKSLEVSIAFARKTLTVPIKSLPSVRPTPGSSAHSRKQP